MVPGETPASLQPCSTRSGVHGGGGHCIRPHQSERVSFRVSSSRSPASTGNRRAFSSARRCDDEPAEHRQRVPVENMKSIADPRLNLLTVLNVQSAKPSKRTSPASRDWHALARKAAKRSTTATASLGADPTRAEPAEPSRALAARESDSSASRPRESGSAGPTPRDDAEGDSGDENEAPGASQDPFVRHFGAESTLVHGHEAEVLAGDRSSWRKGKAVAPGIGEAFWTRPADAAVEGAGALDAEAAQKIVRPSCPVVAPSHFMHGLTFCRSVQP